MRRVLLSLLIGATLLAGIPAQAFWQSRNSNYNQTVGSVPAYSGPADVVASPTVAFLPRGVSGAYSTGSNPAMTIRGVGTGASTQVVNILSNGNLDISTANSFAGVDATATCTIASTTMTCASASSTPHQFSTITGAGITQPCYASSVGTFAGGAGTVTVPTTCGTVSVGVATAFQYGMFLTAYNDQSGGGHNAAQAASGNQPQLLPAGINGLPAVWCPPGASMSATTPSTNTGSWAIVGGRNASPSGNDYFELSTASFIYLSSAGVLNAYMGSNATLTGVTDGVMHAIQIVLNGVSSYLAADGSLSATQDAGSNAAGTALNICFSASSDGVMLGDLVEWTGVAFTPTQAGNIRTNQKTFWGTP